MGTVVRVANGYEPQRADIRAALGLPILKPAPACPHCGNVHVKRCYCRRPTPAPKRRNFRRAREAALKLLWGERSQ